MTADTLVHTALREALTNCIINADYYGRQSLVIIKKKDVITFSNPGNFRIDIEDAKSGGVSDPRNTTLIKMFNLIDIGERAGSGIPNIYRIWDKQGWEAPIITEYFEPARITMSLSVSSDDKRVSIKSDDKRKVTELQKQTIIECLTDNASAKSSELSELLDVKSTRIKNLLNELISDGVVIPEGANRNRRYRLKNKTESRNPSRLRRSYFIGLVISSAICAPILNPLTNSIRLLMLMMAICAF